MPIHEDRLSSSLDSAILKAGRSRLVPAIRVEPSSVASSFALVGQADEALAPFLRQLSAAFRAEGFRYTSNDLGRGPRHQRHRSGPAATRSGAARAARSSRALALLPEQPADGLRETYPLLVRALANIVLCYMPGRRVSFTTMERGYYASQRLTTAQLARERRRALAPLARARLVIDNQFLPDLEHELWHGDACTTQIAAAGRRLDGLGLLPAPFPIEELVDEQDLRHIRRLYGIGGLSYGNLSVRQDASASG